MTEEHRSLGERLLLERISLRGICRAVGVGLRGLLPFRVEWFQAAPAQLSVHAPGSTPAVILPRLAAAIDALWSFGGTTANRQWVWMARDALTRQVMACPVDEGSRQSAEAWWEQIPAV